jgi:hypothetical protein
MRLPGRTRIRDLVLLEIRREIASRISLSAAYRR